MGIIKILSSTFYKIMGDSNEYTQHIMIKYENFLKIYPNFYFVQLSEDFFRDLKSCSNQPR